MKPFVPTDNVNSDASLYIQLYRHIKGEILGGNLRIDEKLPSLRKLAQESDISVTTVSQAYEQLLTEGYITSRPQSGYYVSEIPTAAVSKAASAPLNPEFDDFTPDRGRYLHDTDTFDFLKWKKCSARVFNEYADMLLFESDVQGEAALRFEICKYLYSSRGVSATPEQVVIGAGTQQLTAHLARILTIMGIDMVCTEDPGYLPIQNVFRDRGFAIARIPVTENGISIEKLPVNIPSAVYVSPANQFPTGSVMPIGARYKLLEWARNNNSIILEDDYDSELRYLGKPIPALKGLDESDSVVYFGSFSATLFPAIKISYMILPEKMVRIFENIKADYTQTCSKAEQLTLALFMEDGYYYTNIKRLRKLYAQKLEYAEDAFLKYGRGASPLVDVISTKSGLNMMIVVHSEKTADELCAVGESIGLRIYPLYQSSGEAGDGGSGDSDGSAAECLTTPDYGIAAERSVTTDKKRHLIFYFNQIPLDKIDSCIRDLTNAWRAEY